VNKKIYKTNFFLARLTLGLLLIWQNAHNSPNNKTLHSPNQAVTEKKEKTFGGGLKKSWDINKALVDEAVARANNNSNNPSKNNPGDNDNDGEKN
jgi:hypothetical protein